MHVFVSHSRVNSSAALRLCDELRKRNVDTWLDVLDLATGAEWSQSVAAAIQSAQAFVFLIGPPGFDDRWQTFEWQQVVDREFYLDPAKPLIPILIGNPEIPGFLKTRQALALEDTPESYEKAVDLIVDTLHDPAISVDEAKLALAQTARRRALESLREYSEALVQEDLKRAAIRAVE